MMPSSTSCTEYATSSAQSMTCASRQRARLRAGDPARSQSKTGSVVGVHAELALRRSRRAQGYLQAASRLARVRLSPADPPSGPTTLASSRVSTRSVCALPSKPPHACAASSRASSPLCPNGGWPRSWASPAVSTTSGSQPRLCAHLPGDLGDLERVGQPGAQEPVALARLGGVHLGLRGQPAERGRVQHPGAVAGERAAPAPSPVGRPWAASATNRAVAASSGTRAEPSRVDAGVDVARGSSWPGQSVARLVASGSISAVASTLIAAAIGIAMSAPTRPSTRRRSARPAAPPPPACPPRCAAPAARSGSSPAAGRATKKTATSTAVGHRSSTTRGHDHADHRAERGADHRDQVGDGHDDGQRQRERHAAAR